MQHETGIINLDGVNCYLLKAGTGFILIDTGFYSKRAKLEIELSNAGCKPGDLKLIILTHGDSDHADNCVFLRDKYGAKIAIHKADSGMVENGDMSCNRKAKPDKLSIVFMLMMKIVGLMVKPGKFEKFKPDLYIEEGYDLNEYGLDAHVLHLPGHSQGSVGVLTSGGSLFCGDLIYNFAGFKCIYDLADFNFSIDKLKKLSIKTIYPGHGKPITWEKFMKKY